METTCRYHDEGIKDHRNKREGSQKRKVIRVTDTSERINKKELLIRSSRGEVPEPYVPTEMSVVFFSQLYYLHFSCEDFCDYKPKQTFDFHKPIISVILLQLC